MCSPEIKHLTASFTKGSTACLKAADNTGRDFFFEVSLLKDEQKHSGNSPESNTLLAQCVKFSRIINVNIAQNTHPCVFFVNPLEVRVKSQKLKVGLLAPPSSALHAKYKD